MATLKRGMRKGLTAYGDEDFSLFLRKAFVKAMGYTDDALDRGHEGSPARLHQKTATGVSRRVIFTACGG